MNDILAVPRPRDMSLPELLARIDSGTQLRIMRRFGDVWATYTLQLVLADAIVVRNDSGGNLIIRIDAIDMMEIK